MATQETFLERMKPVLDAMPEGPDKEKLLALVESQDTVERTDVPPKDRARALRRLTQIDSTVNASDRTPGHGRGRVRDQGRPA
jgi:hypothetical protein